MKRLMLILGILIGCLLAPSFAYASYTTSTTSGSGSFSYSTYYSGTYEYTADINDTYIKDQNTVMTSLTGYLSNFSAPNRGWTLYNQYMLGDPDIPRYITFGSTSSQATLTTTVPTSLSDNMYRSSVAAKCIFNYSYYVSTVIPTINYIATYTTYNMDGYTFYVDSNGFVHFVITQNTPNADLIYQIYNSTTGKYYSTTNQGATTLEVVDNNPKVGSTNIYSIQIAIKGYYIAGIGGPAYPNYQYTNIYVQIPADQATYNAITRGTNSNGKSLDATYDNAAAAWNGLVNGPNSNGKSLSATYDNANAANNQTWYGGKYGGSSESTADVAGYIRMLQQITSRKTLLKIEGKLW